MTYVFPYHTAIYTAVLGLLAALLTVKPFVSLKNFTLPVTLTCTLRMSDLCSKACCKGSVPRFETRERATAPGRRLRSADQIVWE